MEILVVGAGSLGSLVGGLLAREHDVTLVGAPAHVEAIRESGLTIDGEIRDRVHPAAITDPAGATADPSGTAADATGATAGPPDPTAELAIVTAKAYDTDRAVETLAECDVEAVWSLQNGLGNEAQLAEKLDVPVLAGTATYGADHTDPGAVTCTGLGEVAIGPRPDTPTPETDTDLARRLGERLSADGTGVEATGEDGSPRLQVIVDEAMPRRLWLKLAVNVGINPVTALARVKNGALAAGDAAETSRRAAREVASVARAEGIEITDETAVAELDAVVAATADNRSSMLQDVDAGDRTEIDAIAGAVTDRSEAHDLPVPTTRTLASLVREWEHGRDLR